MKGIVECNGGSAKGETTGDRRIRYLCYWTHSQRHVYPLNIRLSVRQTDFGAHQKDSDAEKNSTGRASAFMHLQTRPMRRRSIASSAHSCAYPPNREGDERFWERSMRLPKRTSRILDGIHAAETGPAPSSRSGSASQMCCAFWPEPVLEWARGNGCWC